jgi:flagellar basal-body rod modification protein FlgD
MNTINTDKVNPAAAALTGAGGTSKLGQTEFLELMLAQMKNQDPFKPLESGEFLGQIAQFSTVSGIQDLQASFAGVSSALYSNQALQATTLVGRTVEIASEHALLSASGGLQANVVLPESASNIQFNIYGTNGELIHTSSSGPARAGVVGFSWNGLDMEGRPRLPGSYRIEAIASTGDRVTPLETSVNARVDSVSLGGQGDGIRLNLGTLGETDFNKVKQIR